MGLYKRTKDNIHLKSFSDLLNWFSVNFCLFCHFYYITYVQYSVRTIASSGEISVYQHNSAKSLTKTDSRCNWKGQNVNLMSV